MHWLISLFFNFQMHNASSYNRFSIHSKSPLLFIVQMCIEYLQMIVTRIFPYQMALILNETKRFSAEQVNRFQNNTNQQQQQKIVDSDNQEHEFKVEWSDSSHSHKTNENEKCLFPLYYTMFTLEFNMRCAVNRLPAWNEQGRREWNGWREFNVLLTSI